jgi:hypothetical protein
MNATHFQIAMPAYNLNCWLMLFNRRGSENAGTLRHTTLATSRLRFLFLAAKIWRHGGQAGVRYSKQRIPKERGNLGEFSRGNSGRDGDHSSRADGAKGCGPWTIQV